MQKIIYKDVNNDKDNLLMIIDKMYPIYKRRNCHDQLSWCNHWATILSRIPIETKYTFDEILAIKYIMNDSANIFLSYDDFENGELSMNLMNKISSLIGEHNE